MNGFIVTKENFKALTGPEWIRLLEKTVKARAKGRTWEVDLPLSELETDQEGFDTWKTALALTWGLDEAASEAGTLVLTLRDPQLAEFNTSAEVVPWA